MTHELVIGGSGLVGSYLFRSARRANRSVRGTYHSNRRPHLDQLDITHQDETRAYLTQVDPEIIYLPAADPHVDGIEADPEAYRPLNVEAPLHIAEVASDLGAKLVYYSSDYVFDGADGPYREDDPVNPLNAYGRQKVEVEAGLRERIEDHLIIRITVVYGWEPQGKNFVERSLTRLRSGQTVEAPTDQLGTPTYAGTVAEASRELASAGLKGTFHVAGSDRCSRYTFAQEMARVFDLDPSLVEPRRTTALGQAAERPLSAGLSIHKARSHLKTPLLGYKEGLERMKEERTDE